MDTTFTATTTDPPALSISGAPPRSGLAAINNNNDNNKGKNNGTANSAPPSLRNIDFTYSDTDVHLKELAELYRYNEELDFTANRTSFEELMKDYSYSGNGLRHCPDMVERLVAGLELTERATRMHFEVEQALKLSDGRSLVIKLCQNTGFGARFRIKKILLRLWKTP
ncbi:Striatin-interacting protein 2, partial [Tyrophagus putrescentiae]